MKKENQLARSLVFSLLFAGLLGSVSQSQAQLTWTGALGNNDFLARGNYDPSGTGDIPNLSNLVFNGPANLNLTQGKNYAVQSITINSGASGFTLSGDALVVIGAGGFNVASGTDATFNVSLSSHTTDTVIYKISVGAGGNMVVNGSLSVMNKPFEKTGSGRLVLNGGTDIVRLGSEFRIKEGTLELGAGSTLGYGNSGAVGPAGSLPMSLGDAATSAVLTGSGVINAVLTTNSVERALIDPTGTLTIRNLDASSGVSLRFDLDAGDVISGGATYSTNNTLTGGTMHFTFTGGEVGVVYTLFKDFSELVNIDPESFLIVSSGYVLDQDFGNGGWLQTADGIQVRFSAIPESGVTSLLVGAIALAVMLFRRRI